MMKRATVAWFGIGMAAIALGAPACSAPAKCVSEVRPLPTSAEEAPPPAEPAAKEPAGNETKVSEGKADAEPKTKMRTYFMAFLRRGPAWSAEKTPEVTAVSKGHMDHIGEMAKSGALLVAGPFLDAKGPGDLAGIFIFGVASIDEAKALAEADPAVKAGRFTVEVKPWFAGEGLRVNP
ncbi:MAG: YciI family protein [Polyangiaceae bacterium]|nr:YciI family protein [Polyangiaceae bacterium]